MFHCCFPDLSEREKERREEGKRGKGEREEGKRGEGEREEGKRGKGELIYKSV